MNGFSNYNTASGESVCALDRGNSELHTLETKCMYEAARDSTTITMTYSYAVTNAA